MPTLKPIKKWIFLLSVPVFANLAASAENTDAREFKQDSSFLIEKLERVNANLAPQDPSKIAVTLRLSDLLAERARIASMKDLESGCTVCTAGEADRRQDHGGAQVSIDPRHTLNRVITDHAHPQ